MAMSFPGESAQYRAARDELLEQEAEVRRAMEAVAAKRRTLPPGGVVPDDYVFDSDARGGPTKMKFSELFAPGKDTLVIYNMMFPRAPDEDLPCPSCTAFLDSFDGAAEHITQRVNLVVVAKADIARVLAHANDRGWSRLRCLSSAGNTYNRDYFGEGEDGQQIPMLNVFHRYGGEIRHFWGSELMYAPAEPGQDPRHCDTIDALWNLFDFTPEGRGTDWYPDLSYT
jgi:predicted dithiol-disulfide oxidoreductase (DUF899 family)